ncbi:MAG: SpoVR family protein [Bacteriovoracia bacterium]
MYLKSRQFFVTTFFFFLVGFSSYGDHVHEHDSQCRYHLHVFGRLPGNIRVSGTGNDKNLIDEYAGDAKHIYHEVAPDLGYSIHDMFIRQKTARNMAGIVGNNGHAVPFWMDGLRVIQAIKGSAGIYEIVNNGFEAHHQAVRATNTPNERRLVYAHVVGHGDFFDNHYLFKIRKANRVKSSMSLSKLMERLLIDENEEEVTQYYQWLETLGSLQDWGKGTYESPETFIPEEVHRKPVRQGGRWVYPEVEHPVRPTHSILQASVHNMPRTTPQWKKDILALFEKKERQNPASVNTKIMNEGWASLAEYQVLSHSKWVSTGEAIDFGQIMSKVLGTYLEGPLENASKQIPNPKITQHLLKNPYWLGFHCWKNLRDRFFEKPELKEYTHKQKVRLFNKYAHSLMKIHTDYTFIMAALDEKWVKKWNLVLARQGAPTPKGVPFIATTKDAERIIKKIASEAANHELSSPNITLESFNYKETGAVHLKHHPVRDIPLYLPMSIQALYVLSRLYERPVSIETIGSNTWIQKQKPEPEEEEDDDLALMFPSRAKKRKPKPEPEIDLGTFPIVLRVEPSGKVTARGEVNGEIVDLSQMLQTHVDSYIEDTEFSLSDQYVNADSNRVKGFATKIISAMANPAVTAMATEANYTPTAAHAVHKAIRLGEYRLAKKLRMIAERKISPTFKGDKVRIKVYPDIPRFVLDTRFYAMRKQFMKPTLPDEYFRLHMQDSPVLAGLKEQAEQSTFVGSPDEDLDVWSGPWKPGDVWVVPGQGQGKGDGEGEPGEDGDEEGNGNQPGEGGSKDPTYIEIDIEEFADFLLREVGLRNMRDTDGDAPKLEDRVQGHAQKETGEVLWDETMMLAIARGMAIAHDQDLDIHPTDVGEFGLQNMASSDYVRQKLEQQITPGTDAVLYLIADTSGSITEEHRKIEKLMAKNEEALLRKVYPYLKIVYIIYSDKFEEVNEKDFYTKNLSGGTEIYKSLQHVKEDMEKRFPRTRFNRYMHIFTDGDDFKVPQAMAEIRKLAETTDAIAYSHVDPKGGDFRGISRDMIKLSEELPKKLSVSKITSDHGSIIDAILIHWAKEQKK